jgi:hypothetical protein
VSSTVSFSGGGNVSCALTTTCFSVEATSLKPLNTRARRVAAPSGKFCGSDRNASHVSVEPTRVPSIVIAFWAGAWISNSTIGLEGTSCTHATRWYDVSASALSDICKAVV